MRNTPKPSTDRAEPSSINVLPPSGTVSFVSLLIVAWLALVAVNVTDSVIAYGLDWPGTGEPKWLKPILEPLRGPIVEAATPGANIASPPAPVPTRVISDSVTPASSFALSDVM